MEFQWTLGIDMSKDWFNFCVMDQQLKVVWEDQVNNEAPAIERWIDQLHAKEGMADLGAGMVIVEHTGIYVKPLVRCCLQAGLPLSLVPAVKVSDQLAGHLGWEEKTDLLDARRLAEYGHRFGDKLKQWQASSDLIEQLRHLQRQRQRLNNALNMLQVPMQEILHFEQASLSQDLVANQQASVAALQADLKTVEQQIAQLIEQDQHLAELFDLITSVKGIGAVTAREIIIATAAFTSFSPRQAKAFARYVGVIPLKRQSGKAGLKRSRTGKQVNKKIKSLLTMGARSLINTNDELAHFYHRKREQGKSHMCVINAMRNKLILRAFAVVRNRVKYQENLNICLD